MKQFKQFLTAILICLTVIGSAFTTTSEAYTKTYNYSKTMYVGYNTKLKPSKYITSKNTTWTSSNKSYATVTKYGTVTPKKTGLVTITATRKSGSNKFVYKTKVTIKKKYIYKSQTINMPVDIQEDGCVAIGRYGVFDKYSNLGELVSIKTYYPGVSYQIWDGEMDWVLCYDGYVPQGKKLKTKMDVTYKNDNLYTVVTYNINMSFNKY